MRREAFEVNDDVDRLIEGRWQRRHRRGEALALAAAVALHAGVVAAALVLPALGQDEPPPRPEFAVVRVVPLQALGTEDVAPAPQPEAARPEPPVLEPPAPQAQPAPEPAPAPPPPRPTPKPTPPKPQPARPEPSRQEPREEPVREPAPSPSASSGAEGTGSGRRGSPTGSPLGTSAFGSRLGVDDPSFQHDYYLERIAAMIEERWTRPPTEGAVEVMVHFRIEKDGTIAELTVVQPSGHNPFDLAALRAVQNASPLPPLPRSYRKDSLGVNLIFR